MLLIGLKMIKHVCLKIHPPPFCICFILYGLYVYASYYITKVLYFPHVGSSLLSQELLLLSVIWQTEWLCC